MADVHAAFGGGGASHNYRLLLEPDEVEELQSA
jgi:hypothetical protein